MAKKDIDQVQDFKPGMVYSVTHEPTGEEWLLLGINPTTNRVCASGYPPTIAKLSHCTGFVEERPITEKELSYRNEKFGTDWI